MIFAKSYQLGQVPSQFTLANVTPIFKKGSRLDTANYRPVSLTPVPCKIMERIIRDAMLQFLVENRLICASQHGFVFAKSCVTNLLESVDNITHALAEHHDVVVAFLDFAKAFDKVCHRRLIVKLKAYNFDSKLISWIEAFLSSRKQRVVMGEHISDWCDVLSGVPQGSVLGPLLFVIFINDMPDAVYHLCKLFADDTKLIAIIREAADLLFLQEDLDKLVQWAHTWKMMSNAEKCKVMCFEREKPDLLNIGFVRDDMDMANLEVDPHGRHRAFTVCGSNGDRLTLGETTVERDLGVLIDNNLNWSAQIDQVKAKACSVMGALKRSFSYWTPYTFRVLYTTFVRPHLEYCACVWSPSSQKLINALESVQRRATKIVPSVRSLCYEERLKCLGIPSLEERRRRSDIIQQFKIVTGLNEVAWRLPSITQPSLGCEGLAGSVRGHDRRLMRKPVTNFAPRDNFFQERVLPLWNNLPVNLVSAQSTAAFKTNLG
jgi:hypothetical protein